MKKSFLFSMALVAALSSCTKDNSVDNSNNNNNDLVAIEFGTKMDIDVEEVSPASRAAVTAFDGTQELGIYVLAKNLGADETWQGADKAMLWNNVLTTINGTTATPTLVDRVDSKYYPNSDKYNYNFFGYYPRQESPTINDTDKTVTTTIDISSRTVDVLHGKATVAGNGYNATYVKENGVPTINFKHLLTQIQFNIKAAADFGEGTVTVKSVNVSNGTDEITLTIADIDGATAGTVTPTTQDVEFSVVPKSTEGEITSSTTTKVPFGSPVMLYAAESNQAFTVSVTMIDDEGEEVITEAKPVSPTGGFLRGNSYNVTLNMSSFTLVSFEASLTGWVEVKDDVNVDF